MRQVKSLRLALVGGAVGLLGMAGMSFGQSIVNGDFSSPIDTTDVTSTTADGWTLVPTVQTNGNPGNPGQRAVWHQPNGSWGLWVQTFEATGGANQLVSGINAGQTYTFSALWAFELGAANSGNEATSGYNNIPGMYSYMELQFENANGSNVGPLYETDINSGSIPSAMNADAFPATVAGTTGSSGPWIPYSVSGQAPVGATSVEVIFGWTGGGSDSSTGSQSAIATDAALSVPEPASLGLLALILPALVSRRRAKKFA